MTRLQGSGDPGQGPWTQGPADQGLVLPSRHSCRGADCWAPLTKLLVREAYTGRRRGAGEGKTKSKSIVDLLLVLACYDLCHIYSQKYSMESF